MDKKNVTYVYTVISFNAKKILPHEASRVNLETLW